MIDVKKNIVAALRTSGLDVYFENFVNSATKLPCITYVEYDNSVLAQGDTLGYSTIIYHVKVWADNMNDLALYSAKVDDIMRKLGFTRRNTVELWLDGIGQRQMKYEAKAQEYFVKELDK